MRRLVIPFAYQERARRAPPLRRCRRAALMLALLAVSVQAGRAEENECRRPPRLSEGAPPTFGRVVAAERTAFVRDGLAQPGCPEAGARCRERAYLVQGDPVLLGERRGAYLCVSYPSARSGLERTGWLPAAAVAADPSAPEPASGWFGTWKRAEAWIGITAGKAAGALAIAGSATWGAGDPDRVRRGGIHTGEIEAEAAPAAGALSFAMGESATLPVEKGDADDCKVWMRRVGPWLVVDDNLRCGGVNVSFRGVYGRDGGARP
ncbi:MAG: hypothetical protein PGN34_00250 [Methylobacterium frigidaeris]